MNGVMKKYPQAALVMCALVAIPAITFAAQPTFRERYNGLATQLVPSLTVRECKVNRSIGQNRDSLAECTLATPGAILSLGSLNNKLTGVLLRVEVGQLENSRDLMKVGRVLLRLARNRDAAADDPVEMTAIIVEAQKKPGKNICEDTPTLHTQFCVSMGEKNTYYFGIVELTQQ